MDAKPRFPDHVRVDYGTKALSDPKKLAEFRRQEEERLERRAEEQFRRARADVLARFKPQKWEHQPWVYVCPFCSAFVSEPEKHLDWHEALNETAAQASRANAMTTPIG